MPGGPLRPGEHERHVSLSRPAADPALDTWVERCWSVRWALPTGQSYLSEVLTHPSVHLTVESGAGSRHGFPLPTALLHGVVTRKFSVQLTGEGAVFGVKFRPGGFGAFTGIDVGTLSDRVMPLTEIFGDAARRLQRTVLDAPDDDDRAAVVSRFLLDRLPPPDPQYEQLLTIVAGMVADRSLTTVEQVTERFDISVRRLQRLSRRYVGVGPKWMLQRFRLQDAARLLDEGAAPSLAVLAAQLGWYDQAHFTRDFTDLVGVSPAAYAAQAAAVGQRTSSP